MTYTATYYTLGDRLVTRTVQAADEEAAIKVLVNDPQQPLGQLVDITEDPEP
jgi:hypothetical protein